MKTIAFLLLLAAPTVFAQGPLTPPGAPAPTMKSLNQIEPRRPISQADIPANGYYSISEPGSYYLTENVSSSTSFSGVIYITSSNVTLDLNGFTITQTNTSASNFTNGIFASIPAVANLVVRNGTIVGPTVRSSGGSVGQGTFSEASTQGIYIKSQGSSVSVPTMRFENLTVRNWGFAGISLDYPYDGETGRSVISNCSFINIGEIGIRCRASVISGCSISQVGTQGIEGSNNVIERVMIERAGGVGIAGDLNTVRAVNMRWIGSNGMGGVQHNIAQLNVTGADNGLAVTGSIVVEASLCNNRSHGLNGTRNTVSGTTAHANAGSGFNGDSNSYRNVTATSNTSQGISGAGCSVDGAMLNSNGSHGIVGANTTIRGAKASSNGGAGVYCDSSSISDCVADNNGDDGIRGIGSVISNCRAFLNDKTAGGYVAVGIAWSGGKILNSLADTASPAIP
ncbi:hypothetical protein [Haloferula sp. BvORR071]|uniref:hypothetical protein n=1 Tax=Haloferula sp. BvORR071 TaxID=1396141 RepID=UPI000558FBF8|nr:hypothetical protein [Haloferula sp. BvORR071]